jgi:hypothetical protein
LYLIFRPSDLAWSGLAWRPSILDYCLPLLW